ncbi:hypothetical protein GF420_00790 [candidate division GN15 bacterium]|nr:hypothetical protein [candidate division GN15 bacterium]
MKRITVGCLTWLLATCAVADWKVGDMAGVIRDEMSGEPVEGVFVTLVQNNLCDSTDADGRFEIKWIPIGTYDLSVSHSDFDRLKICGLEVVPDSTTSIDVLLPPILPCLTERQTAEITRKLIELFGASKQKPATSDTSRTRKSEQDSMSQSKDE